MKQCSACKHEKVLTDFHKDSSKKDGCTSTCKACAIARTKQYYAQNKERVLERVSEWVDQNRDKHNKKCNAWAKRNKASVNARTARRYAAKTQATPSFVTHNPDFMWMIQEAYDLAQMRTKMFDTPWEVDHIVPLRGKKASGLHTPWNLRVIPMSENRRKSNTFGEFA